MVNVSGPVVGQSQAEPRRWHGPQKHQERTQTIFGSVFRIRIQLWVRPKIEKTIFSIKNIYLQKMICFVIYEIIIHVL